MEENHMHEGHCEMCEQTIWRRYRPLIIMFALVLIASAVHTWWVPRGWHGVMTDIMAFYFLFFGALKIINIRGFASSYRNYDSLARTIPGFSWLYPFIEIALGLAYFFGYSIFAANIVTIVLMSWKAESVYAALRAGDDVQCACLGGFFKIQISWVTFFEDAIMALMAIAMLFLPQMKAPPLGSAELYDSSSQLVSVMGTMTEGEHK